MFVPGSSLGQALSLSRDAQPSGIRLSRDDGLPSCHERAPGSLRVVRHLFRATVSSEAEVVEFKERGQLGVG